MIIFKKFMSLIINIIKLESKIEIKKFPNDERGIGYEKVTAITVIIMFIISFLLIGIIIPILQE